MTTVCNGMEERALSNARGTAGRLGQAANPHSKNSTVSEEVPGHLGFRSGLFTTKHLCSQAEVALLRIFFNTGNSGTLASGSLVHSVKTRKLWK